MKRIDMRMSFFIGICIFLTFLEGQALSSQDPFFQMATTIPLSEKAFSPPDGSLTVRWRPLAVGMYHACAIWNNESIICWGNNDWSQLGIPNKFRYASLPVVVQGFEGEPVTLAAGDEHTCVALADGRVECWGGNWNGQLGIGSSSPDLTYKPVFVTGLEDKVIDLDAGSWHTCALLQNGHVQCWGANNTGQLGDGSSTDRARPVTVPLPGPAVWITAGCNHTCALLKDGRVFCWGWNQYSQLGDGTNLDHHSPVLVTNFTGQALIVEAGCNHTCVAYIEEDGQKRYRCWGGTTDLITGKSSFSSLLLMRSGVNYTCVLTEEHNVLCWGDNSYGQLGDGTRTNHLDPLPVLGLDGNVIYFDIGAGSDFSCAAKNDGSISCWGKNFNGQIGNGSLVMSSVPVSVKGLANFQQVDVGNDFTCAVLSDESISCWGKSFNTSFHYSTGIPTTLPGVTGVKDIDAGGDEHSCLLMQDGEVRCWGKNDFGQLGDGSTNCCSTSPVTVSGLGGAAKEVRVGAQFSCALLEDGSVHCWGSNDHGQLGTGNTLDSPTPLTVQLPDKAKSLALGWNHACAVLVDGSLYCWGYNKYGQIGDGTTIDRSIPVRVVLPSQAVDVRTGDVHTCALLENGQLWCWGSNNSGQLGNPLVQEQSKRPIQVLGLKKPVTSFDAGGFDTCAIMSGTLQCWGSNEYGQVGAGTYDLRPVPTQVLGLKAGVHSVRVALNHVCATVGNSESKQLLCWGSDQFGQLGQDRDLFWTKPTPVGKTISSYTIDTPAEILTQLYIGYFNRKPDCQGLSYWVNTYTGGRSFADIVYDFAASQEAVHLYPYLGNTSAYSPEDFIIAIYNNLFGRDPEPDGLHYWLNQLQSGALLAPEMVYAIIEGAKAPTGSAEDKATLESKVHNALEASKCLSQIQ